MYDNYRIYTIILTSVRCTINNGKNPIMYDNFRVFSRSSKHTSYRFSLWPRIISQALLPARKHVHTHIHTHAHTQAPHGVARNPLPARQHYYTTVLPLQFRSMTACNLYRKRIPQPTTSANTAQVDVASDDDSDLEIEFESFEC